MSLTLGKTFNRTYQLRINFLTGYYNIQIFFDKRSSFLLFGVDADFSGDSQMHDQHGIKINMFKNIESSKFCETFLDLHNYRSSNLDIVNQFNAIKSDYYDQISFLFNETIILSKAKIEEKDIFDELILYGLTLNAFSQEFIFILAERHNIIKKLNKKVVRTTAMQIATSASFKLLSEFHDDYRKYAHLNFKR